MTQYLLAAHAFICMVGDHAVFLDLKQDKYTALPAAEAAVLRGVVKGWPMWRTGSASASETGTPDSEAVADMLLREGLLTRDARRGKDATPVALQPASTALMSGVWVWPRLGIGHVLRFIHAWLWITVLLKCCRLEYVVRRVQRRKQRAMRRGARFDFQLARRLVTLYFRMQPRAFSPIDACLRNSLTLAEFLAKYGLYPTWVFGVRMPPFAAHAWLQEGPVVINDHVAHVRTFTPIMTI